MVLQLQPPASQHHQDNGDGGGLSEAQAAPRASCHKRGQCGGGAPV